MGVVIAHSSLLQKMIGFTEIPISSRITADFKEMKLCNKLIKSFIVLPFFSIN